MSNSHVASSTAEEAPDPVAASPTKPAKLTFRITRVTLFVVFLVALCITPVACARMWLLPLYLIPLGLTAWILRVRTTVTASGIVAHTMTATKRLSWDDIASFQLSERQYVRAVPHTGEAVTLPSVRVRDLGHLAALSGGRLSDPNAVVESEDVAAESDAPTETEEPETENTADNADRTSD